MSHCYDAPPSGSKIAGGQVVGAVDCDDSPSIKPVRCDRQHIVEIDASGELRRVVLDLQGFRLLKRLADAGVMGLNLHREDLIRLLNTRIPVFADEPDAKGRQRTRLLGTISEVL